MKSNFHPSSALPALESQGYGYQGVLLGIRVFPESIAAWNSSGETVQSRSGIHISQKRGRVIPGVFSRTGMAKVLFLKLYHNAHAMWAQE